MRFLPPFELPLMEETQAGYEIGDHRCGPVNVGIEVVAARGSS